MYLCMIKILFVGSVMTCCTMIGWNVRKSFFTKMQYFQDLVKFCEQLQQNMQSKKEKVNIFVQKYLSFYHGQFQKDIEMYFLKRENPSLDIVNQQEREEILQFFNCLGHLTIDEEVSNVISYQKTFEHYLSLYTSKYEKYGNLILKLSSLVGAIICIVLY